MRKYPLKTPPTPYEEPVNPEWEPEVWDTHLPTQRGFITDFVLATRGIETPTKFAVLGALFGISTIIKRHAALQWYPEPLYPNLFLIFVAPPRICAKSTSVKLVAKVAEKVPELLGEETQMGVLKKLNIVRSKITPEAIYDVLKPYRESVDGGSVDHGSTAAFIVSELTTLLGKQKYNTGLIDTLTKFYDSDARDDETTRGQGRKELRNIYVTFFGATTPSSLEKSLPEEAFGGGFMSRVIMSVQKKPTRYYPYPFLPKDAPSLEELSHRLAWIAQNAQGEYVLDKEAKKRYFEWYRKFKDELASGTELEALEKSRMDTNLLKFALLVRAQRYEPGRVITVDDFNYALELLEDAYDDDQGVLDNIGTSPAFQLESKVTSVLKLFPVITRKDLLQKIARHITTEMADKILDSLAQREQIEIFQEKDGKVYKQSNVTRQKNEKYKWMGS